MSFAASTVRARYIAAGNQPILKQDFTKICDDLLILETFAGTASDQAGKFFKILLAGASTGASSVISGGAVSEITVTPATNIPLRHLGSTAFLETSADHFKKISLGASCLLSTNATAVSGHTNIGLLNLKGATLTQTLSISIPTHKFNIYAGGSSGGMVVTTTGAGTFPVLANGSLTYSPFHFVAAGPAVSAFTFRYFILSGYVGGSTSTTAQTVLYNLSMGGNFIQSGPSASTQQATWDVMLNGFSSATNATDNGGTGSTVTFHLRVIEISEV